MIGASGIAGPDHGASRVVFTGPPSLLAPSDRVNIGEGQKL